MPNRANYLAALLPALAAPAYACPTAEDTATGVRIELDGGHTILTRAADGTVTETEVIDDWTNIYISDNGVLETGYRGKSDEAEYFDEEMFAYTFDLSDVLPLQEWHALEGEQIVLNKDGDETERVPFSFHTRSKRPFEIGDCTYSSISFQTYYNRPDDKLMVEFVYLIELDLPVATAFVDRNGVSPNHLLSISAVSNE